LYVPFPETVAVPTVVPPLVQSDGALAWGPKTVYVIVPPAPFVAPERPALSELLAIADPGEALAGADAVSEVTALATTVEAIPVPQVLAAALSLASPP
jgi:hypothetical protein